MWPAWSDPLDEVLERVVLMNDQLAVTLFGVHITYVAETDDLGDYAGVHFLMEKVK